MEDAPAAQALGAALELAQAMSLAPGPARARALAGALGAELGGLVVLVACGPGHAAPGSPAPEVAAREAAVAGWLRGLEPGPHALLAWEPDHVPTARLARPACGSFTAVAGEEGARAVLATWRDPPRPLGPREQSLLRASAHLAAARLGELACAHAGRRERVLAGVRARAVELGLTPREAEVAVLAALGLSNREVARELGTSPETVKDHLAASYRKTGLRGRGRLAAALLGASP